jgi:hypothetical protein
VAVIILFKIWDFSGTAQPSRKDSGIHVMILDGVGNAPPKIMTNEGLPTGNLGSA